jgi:hypothetical protein
MMMMTAGYQEDAVCCAILNLIGEAAKWKSNLREAFIPGVVVEGLSWIMKWSLFSAALICIYLF